MLVLGTPKRWVPWPEAGIELQLSPLTSQRRQELVAETTHPIYDEQTGKVKDFQRDVAEYARRVGQECIHGWRGLKDEDGKRGKGVMMPHPDNPKGKPVQAPCDAEHIGAFMQIDPAQRFVFRQVEGLGLYLDDQVEQAKKD